MRITYSFLSFLALNADYFCPPCADENDAYRFIPPLLLAEPLLLPLALISGNFTSLIFLIYIFQL